MATNLYEAFSNPLTGETFKRIPNQEDIYSMEWTVQPKGYAALEHIHYYQDEIFHVKKGQLRILIDGKETIASVGETVIVPRGKSHIPYNNTDEVLECVVDYTPMLDYPVFFQFFIGLQIDKDYDTTGKVSIPKMSYFIFKTKLKALARPTSIPAPFFKMAVLFFGVAGSLAGWNKQLERYIGE